MSKNAGRSLSARRAWIEILTDDVSTGGKIVALRKESVDRNISRHSINFMIPVALRKESVDRNAGGLLGLDSLLASLSARRAWIEMTQFVPITTSDVCRSPQGERG